MTDLKINTDSALAAANSIKNINNRIRDGFSSVQNEIARLDSAWDSPAATNAIGQFNEIKNKYPDARYSVIDNYVNFILRQVGEGYTQTEDTNKSLADAFK